MVSWGVAKKGGDNRPVGATSNAAARLVRDRLFDVLQLRATSWAFCALRADGCLVTWGDPERGGQAPRLQMGVCQVCACGDGFACLDRLGRATCWGDPSLCAKLEGVRRLSASSRSFAALMKDGSVQVWGERRA